MRTQALVEVNGVPKMRFYGMSSREAMNKYAVERCRVPGVGKTGSAARSRGAVENTLQDILGGVRSACTYVGARQLKGFRSEQLVRVTQQLNEVSAHPEQSSGQGDCQSHVVSH